MGRDAIVRNVVLLTVLLACAGPGRAEAQTLTPEIHDFGNVAIDTVLPPQAFTFTNTLPTPLTVTQAVFDGIDATRFSVAQTTCTQPLPPQAACAVSVVFSPVAAGPAVGILTVRYVIEGNPSDQRIGAQLLGNGAVGPPPPPAADVGLTLALDATEVSPGAALTLAATVSNLGPDAAQSPAAALDLPAAAGNIVASGNGWACNVAGVTVSCERATLAAGAVAPISVQFTAPQAAGTYPVEGSVASTTADPAPANNAAAIAFDVVASPPPPPPARPVVRVPSLDSAGIALLALAVLLLGWRIRPR